MKRITALGVMVIAFLLCLNLASAEVQAGFKAGDWIKYELLVSGGTSPPPDMPQWVKAECTSVAGTSVTLRMTMHMSNGTERMETWTIDIVSGSGNAAFQAIIPANSMAGDTIRLVNDGNLTIAGEATGTYAGASRTFVYASLTDESGQHTYRWDKQTGVLLEISLTQGSASIAYKATSTNIWQASSNPLPMPSLPIELLSIIASVVVAICIVATAITYTKHKRG